jgi:hypothetical protein
MNQEDREFDGARRFIRFAGNTVKNVVSLPPSSNPASTAQAAAIAAARRYLPGLLRETAPDGDVGAAAVAGRAQTGRWLRRGGKIVLYGV